MPELLEGVPLPDGIDQDAAAAASAAVRDYCDWHIAPLLTETVKVPVSRDRVAQLPTLRVVSVASVNGVTSGYDWLPNGRLLVIGVPHTGTVEVVFTHGYATCPPAVQAAVLQLAARGLIPKAQLKSDTTGPYGASWYEQADPLDSVFAYRRIGVA